MVAMLAMVAMVAMCAMVAMSDLCLFKAHHVVSKRTMCVNRFQQEPTTDKGCSGSFEGHFVFGNEDGLLSARGYLALRAGLLRVLWGAL